MRENQKLVLSLYLVKKIFIFKESLKHFRKKHLILTFEVIAN